MSVFLDGYVCWSIYLMFFMDDLWFLSVRMKKQYFSHLKNMNFVTFMDVFMVFVSENEKTGTFSHLCLVYGFCQ
jgi:hypothetical protein